MRKLKQQGGYVLHEILLAATILVPLGVYALQRQSAGLEEAKGVQNAERTQDFTELALNYYRANATGILAAMTDGSGADQVCRLNVTPTASTPATTGIQANSVTLHTCAIDASVLKWKGFAPAWKPS